MSQKVVIYECNAEGETKIFEQMVEKLNLKNVIAAINPVRDRKKGKKAKEA